MTAAEATQIQQVSTTQAVMKEHQRNMQNDIDELKSNTKEINEKLDILTAKLDNISGGKQALMWITGVSLTIAGLVIAFLNANKH